MPKIAEACILHYADLVDSQIKNYMQRMEEAKKLTDDEWAFIFDSDMGRNRLIYLGKTETEK